VAATSCTLTTRFGKTIASPDDVDLRRALEELFNEKVPGLTEDDYAEHPSAWLTYVTGSGAAYVLDVYRKGRVVFATYTDRDDPEPVEEYEIDRIAPEEIEELWTWLCDGDVDRVRALRWRAA
jgi:hypothetical protein